jgi:hypothetical protein
VGLLFVSVGVGVEDIVCELMVGSMVCGCERDEGLRPGGKQYILRLIDWSLAVTIQRLQEVYVQ